MVNLRTSLRLSAVLGAVLVSGCITISNSQYRAVTAGLVGCPAEEITISGEKTSIAPGDDPVTWRAACRGHQFICGGAGKQAVCTEELKPAQAPPANPNPKP